MKKLQPGTRQIRMKRSGTTKPDPLARIKGGGGGPATAAIFPGGNNPPLLPRLNTLSYLASVWTEAAQSLFVIRTGNVLFKIFSPAASMETLNTFVPRQVLKKSHYAAAELKRLIETFLSNNTEAVLRYLLEFIGLLYSANYELRKHIKNLNAKYQFKFDDRDAAVSAEVRSGRLRVSTKTLADPDVSLTFRNAAAFKNLFFAAKPDILASLLKQDIIIDGNLTYLYKLAFLLKRMERKIMAERQS